MNVLAGTVFESNAETTRNGSAPEAPSADSSTAIAGRRGILPSDSMRAASSVTRRSVRRPCTTPVRKAPLIAVPGRYGPLGPVLNVGINKCSACVRSQILRRTGMFERNAAAGIVLRETAPGGEVELVGSLQLREITFQTRTFGEQTKDAPLIENVDMIFPHHVVDGGKPLAVADQRGRQAGQTIIHAATRQGIGMVTANPAR